MNAQRNRFGLVDYALAKVGGAFRACRTGARAKRVAARAPAMFEQLEHRQMMSVTTPGTGLPPDMGSSPGTYMPTRPSAITTIQLGQLGALN